MHAPEHARGARVVASPAAVDAVAQTYASDIVRFAPDEALVVDADVAAVTDLARGVDPYAIVEDDSGWHMVELDADRFAREVAPILDWQADLDRRAAAQGLLRAVPVKIVRRAGRVRIYCVTNVAHELAERLP